MTRCVFCQTSGVDTDRDAPHKLTVGSEWPAPVVPTEVTGVRAAFLTVKLDLVALACCEHFGMLYGAEAGQWCKADHRLEVAL